MEQKHSNVFTLSLLSLLFLPRVRQKCSISQYIRTVFIETTNSSTFMNYSRNVRRKPQYVQWLAKLSEHSQKTFYVSITQNVLKFYQHCNETRVEKLPKYLSSQFFAIVNPTRTKQCEIMRRRVQCACNVIKKTRIKQVCQDIKICVEIIDTIQKCTKNQRYIKKLYNVKKNSSFY